MKKTKKRLRLKGNNFQKMIYLLTILTVVSSPFMMIYAKATLSKVNYEVEEAKEKIIKEEKENESLQMKINELASLENLESIAKEKGLSYTSDSVKTVK